MAFTSINHRKEKIMTDMLQEKIRWVKTWQKAALSLKAIKKSELQAYDYYKKNRIFLDEMLQYAYDNSKVRLSSGLVEQQRLFMKMNEIKNIRER